MSNQESPDVEVVTIRVRQDLKLALQKLAAQRGYHDLAAMLRELFAEAVAHIELTADDYREIARRVDERRKLLDGRRAAKSRNAGKGAR